MSRTVSSTSDYIVQGSAAFPTTGMLSMWAYNNWAWNDGQDHEFFRIRNDSGGIKLICIQKYTDNQWYCGWYNAGADSRIIASASGLPTSAWAHLLLTWGSGGTTLFYLNGSLVGSHGTANTWNTAGVNRVLGKDEVGNDGCAAAGLAEYAVWNTATVTASDIAALAAGVSPLLIRPGSLQDYMPIHGLHSPEPNLMSSASGTVTGTTSTNHPRVIRANTCPRVFIPPTDYTIVNDAFTDTNSTALASHAITPTNPLSAAWAVQNGTHDIQSNRANNTSGAAGGYGAIAYCDSQRSDVVITATVNLSSTSSPASVAYLVFRWQDASNFWLLRLGKNQSGLQGLSIYERVAGTFSQRASDSTFDPTTGDHTLKLVLSGPSISGTVDGAHPVGYASSNGQTATKHGFGSEVAGDRIDDFIVLAERPPFQAIWSIGSNIVLSPGI